MISHTLRNSLVIMGLIGVIGCGIAVYLYLSSPTTEEIADMLLCSEYESEKEVFRDIANEECKDSTSSNCKLFIKLAEDVTSKIAKIMTKYNVRDCASILKTIFN